MQPLTVYILCYWIFFIIFRNVDIFFYNLWHLFLIWQFLYNFGIFFTIFTIFYNFYNFWQLTTIFTIQTIAFAILTIEKTILETCDIWDTDYNSDNWEPEFMTIFGLKLLLRHSGWFCNRDLIAKKNDSHFKFLNF